MGKCLFVKPRISLEVRLGRDILSLRYNSDRRRDASCPDATPMAIFGNHVGRTTRDVPAPLTVPYSLQQQGINKGQVSFLILLKLWCLERYQTP